MTPIKPLILLTAILASISMSAQNVGQIKNDANYLYGEGNEKSFRNADVEAVKILIDKLSRITGTDNAIIATYKSDISANSDRIVIRNEPDAEILRYMLKKDISKIFAARSEKITQMLAFAESAESKIMIDEALRYYHWADILSRSLPNPDDLLYKERSGTMRTVSKWLPGKIKSILDSITVEYDQENAINNGILEVTFKYMGKPVRSLDYTYFDGNDWSCIYSAKDGRGVIELGPKSDIGSIQIKYEYFYSDMVHINKEVGEVEAAIHEVMYPQSNTPLAIISAPRNVPPVGSEEIKQKVLDVLANRQHSAAHKDLSLSVTSVTDPSAYEKAISSICSAIARKDYSSIDTLFTTEGYTIFTKLIAYGNALILGFDDLFLYGMGDEVYCRSIPMVFSFENNNRKFVEKVVFTFDTLTKKVSNISFALSDHAAADITSKTTWSEEARIILVSFLENYKTAYALKRLDYISSIFDEDALIITGRVLNRTSTSGEFNRNRYVQLTRQNKEQYIKNLGRSFASKEYINIQFADNEVIKMGKGGEMYGIQIRQDYFSSNYADSGYLFLMVDLNDHNRPIIHVRTWQEEPDKDFGIIGPYHF